ncbi:MAG: FAD-dependent oxidoreductase, partial [Candidatus Omnitrophica bacterium]|nr:FAD-dependent oxidoreductase [Candidatus Omnitrophota bacterium]
PYTTLFRSVSVGRSPVTDGLGLDDLGVKREKGLIITDRYRKTNIPGIYAAGDCASRVMLAHLAAHQGEIAAGNILDPSNPSGSLDANIPSCVFTDPEIASVGLSEEEARLKLADVETLKFDFLGSGMARIMDETEGFIKVIRDKKSDEIAGASIIGPRATELIGIFTVAVQSRLKVSQLRRAVLAHPTLSECVSSVLNKQES